MTGSRVDLLVLRWVPTELITPLDGMRLVAGG